MKWELIGGNLDRFMVFSVTYYLEVRRAITFCSTFVRVNVIQQDVHQIVCYNY